MSTSTSPPDPGGTTGPLPQVRGRRRARAVGALLAAVVIVTGVAVWAVGRDSERRPAGLDVYRGLGAWVDVFDYVAEIGGDAVPVAEADIDAMAAHGVRTIYLQAAFDSDAIPDGVVPADRLVALLRRAHDHGINVVGWYAPRYLDVEEDLRRLTAIARFDQSGQRFDGVAIDIEDRSLADAAERGRRAVQVSERLRDDLGDEATIAAVVLPTVLLEKVNRRFWPGFPWAELAPHYDVWMPMTYWTDRLESSGYRDPGTLIAESVARTRALTGLGAQAPVHPIGGIGDQLAEGELVTYADALNAVGAIGGSIYDYRTMPSGGWGVLRGRVPD